MYYAGIPMPGMEWKQVWEIEENGYFRFHTFGLEADQPIEKRVFEMRLAPDVTEEIVSLLKQIDAYEQRSILTQWSLDVEGLTLSGSMNGCVFAHGIDVTERIRALIPIQNFWVFNSVDQSEAMGYCVE